MNEEDRELIRAVGVPEMIVGQRGFLDWLNSVGISIKHSALDRARRAHGIPSMRDRACFRTCVYPKELIRRYVRALVGVDAERWIEAREEDRARGHLRSFRVWVSPNTMRVTNVGPLYAMVARLPKSGYEQVVVRDGKMLICRRARDAVLWDPSRELWHPRIRRYDDVFAVDPNGTLKIVGRPGRSASSLLCVYAVGKDGLVSFCKVPAPLVGYENDLMLDAVIPGSFPKRDELVRYARSQHPRVWVWVWRKSIDVLPVTLEPVSYKASSKEPAVHCENVIDVDGAGPGQEPVERDAKDVFADPTINP